jgi:glycerol kinase
LKIIKKSSEVEALATSVDNTDGVYLVPAFAGLGAPHWDPNARGTLFGISRGTTDAHIARAALESIAYQTHDILKAMEADSKTKIKELRVDGGATENQFLLQFQADILKSTVVKPKVTETTAMGAAFLAGLAVGFWKDLNELQAIWQEDKQIAPNKTLKLSKNLEEWNRAVNAVIYWANNK